MMSILFTPTISYLGGIVLGVGALLLYIGIGRIAGISGILGDFLEKPFLKENRWRFFFILGLFLSYFAFRLLVDAVNIIQPTSWLGIIVGAFFMGLGAAIGSGCTSGHGICGLARLSMRSFIAVIIFMSMGFLAATFIYSIGR